MRRRLLCLVAGTGSVFSTVGAVLPWWTGDGVSVSLTAMELCDAAGRCAERRLDGFGGAGAWPDLALATAAAGIATALVLAASAVGAALGRRLSTVSWAAGVFSLFYVVLSLLVLGLRPEIAGLSPGYGVAVALSGAILGIVFSLAARRYPPDAA